MSADLVARLRLIRSPSIGPVSFRQLLVRFGSAEAAPVAVPDLAARGGGRSPNLITAAAAEREIAQVEALGARFLIFGQGRHAGARSVFSSTRLTA